MSFKTFGRKIIYPLILLAIVLFVAILNYDTNTWLTGWDNIHSEFNFAINFERHFMAAWQEYQGLGLAAGMAHASDIPRFVILNLLDLILPTNAVRYSYMIFCLYWGALGFYFLMSWLLNIVSTNKASSLELKVSHQRLFSFLGAVFFIFNIGTLLTFYNPISMFPTQWAFLPWLYLFFFKCLSENNRRNYLWFALLTLFAAPMSYTPTIFAVYAFTIAVMGIVLLIQAIPKRNVIHITKRLIALALITFAMSSFWIGSFLYFNLSGGGEIVQESAINEIISEDIYARNRARGGVEDVMLLRGFTLDNYDYRVAEEDFGVMMDAWVVHNYQPVIASIGYISFAIIVLGVIYSFKKKIPYRYPLLAVFLLALFVLLNSNPPLGFIFDALREISPTFKEALRFPYTKFAQVATLLYAIFFTFGIIAVYKASSRILRFDTIVIIALSVILMLTAYMAPALSGDFFYKELRVEIPSEYWDMFEWFEKQPIEPRVANLPQHNFMNWRHYRWGSRGSGFIWYGIKQPVLDRSFDIWSKENEQYYNELNHALYTEDFDALEELAVKYHIGWFLYDESIYISDREYDKQTPFYKETVLPNLIKRDNFEIAESFGDNLVIIEFKPVTEEYQNIRALTDYTELSSDFQSSNIDPADTDDYILSDLGSDYLLRDNKDFENEVRFENGQILYKNTLYSTGVLNIPDYWETETLVPVNLYASSSGGLISIKTEYLLPTYTVDDTKIFPEEELTQEILFDIGDSIITSKMDAVRIKNVTSQPKKLGSLALTEDEDLQIHSLDQATDISLEGLESSEAISCGELSEGKDPVVNMRYKDGIYLLKAKNGSSCISEEITGIDNSSLIKLDFKYKSSTGNYPRVCIGNSVDNCIEPTLVTPLRSATENFKTFENYYRVEGRSEGLKLFLILDSVTEGKTSELEIADIIALELPYLESIESIPIETEGEVSLPTQSKYVQISYPVIEKLSLAPQINLFEVGQMDNTNCGGNELDEDSRIYNKEYELDDGQLKFTSQDAISCAQLWVGTKYPTFVNYLLNINADYIEGQPLQIQVNNHLYNSQWQDFTLPEVEGLSSTSTLLTRNSLKEVGFDISALNISRGDFITKNSIDGISLQFIPLDFIKQTQVSNSKATPHSELIVKDYSRIAPFLYSARVDGSGVLELRQSFNDGWVILGADAEHTKVNNWSNGWIITDSNNDDIKIVYLPQILDFIGYAIVITSTVVLVVFAFKKSHKKNQISEQ